MTKYRNKIEIVADILKVAEEGAKKTHIIYQGNLSFKLATAYLKAVLKAGLLVFSREHRFYMPTEKGRMFLARFNKYSRSAKNLEEQNARVKKEMIFLEQLCFVAKKPDDRNPTHKTKTTDKNNDAAKAKNRGSQLRQNTTRGRRLR